MASPLASDARVVLLAGPDAAALASLEPAAELLRAFGVGVVTAMAAGNVVDAARLDDRCAVIVASADAALPAALARATPAPVIRVPTPDGTRQGLALLTGATARVPAGVADAVFATMSIGEAGAKNAALFVVAALALEDDRLRAAYAAYRARQTDAVLNHPPLET